MVVHVEYINIDNFSCLIIMIKFIIICFNWSQWKLFVLSRYRIDFRIMALMVNLQYPTRVIIL